MKITKKAKSVVIRYKEMTTFRAFYQCPSCKTHFEDGTINEKITRFKCSHCGQELIVKIVNRGYNE